MKLRRKKFDLPAYTERVVAILSDEFGWDATVEGIMRRNLNSRTDGFRPPLELICDSPVSAMFRLKANSEGMNPDPWLLRMAYYGDNPERQERADRITLALFRARHGSEVDA